MAADTAREQGPQVGRSGLGAGLDALHGRIAHRFRRRRCGRGRGGTWRGCSGGRSARTAGSWPRRPGSGTRGACSACWTRPAGTRTRCATTCGPTWSSTWATTAPCSSWSRRVSSRRGRSRPGCSGSTTDGRAPGEQPGRRLLVLRHPAGAGLPRPGAVPAPELGQRRPAARTPACRRRCASRRSRSWPGRCSSGRSGRRAGGLGRGRHGLRHRPGAAALAGGGAPGPRPGRPVEAPRVGRHGGGSGPPLWSLDRTGWGGVRANRPARFSPAGSSPRGC